MRRSDERTTGLNSGLFVFAITLAAAVLSSLSCGGPEPTPTSTPACPVGFCLYVQDWPPFTVIYRFVDQKAINIDGDEVRRTIRLEWTKYRHWKATVIDEEKLGPDSRLDRVGSWQQQKGDTWTTSHAWDSAPQTKEAVNALHAPPGYPAGVSFYKLGERTDGELVWVDVEICHGGSCTQGAFGRQFSHLQYIEDDIYTDDAWRILLKSDNVEVLSLQIHAE